MAGAYVSIIFGAEMAGAYVSMLFRAEMAGEYVSKRFGQKWQEHTLVCQCSFEIINCQKLKSFSVRGVNILTSRCPRPSLHDEMFERINDLATMSCSIRKIFQ